jgi:hypothetical protein
MRATAEVKRCQDCRAMVIAAINTDARDTLCDVIPLSRPGELAANIAGRRTLRLDTDQAAVDHRCRPDPHRADARRPDPRRAPLRPARARRLDPAPARTVRQPRHGGPVLMTDPSEPGRRCPGRRHWRPGTISTFCDYCGHTEEGDGWITRRMAIAVFGISERTLYRWISIGLVATLDRHVYTDDIRAAVRLRHADTGNAEGA